MCITAGESPITIDEPKFVIVAEVYAWVVDWYFIVIKILSKLYIKLTQNQNRVIGTRTSINPRIKLKTRWRTAFRTAKLSFTRVGIGRRELCLNIRGGNNLTYSSVTTALTNHILQSFKV